MQSTFAINLLDLMMYFVPGILVLVPVVKHIAPHLFDLDHNKLGLLRYLAVIGFCFLMGVVFYKLSGLYIYPYEFGRSLFGSRMPGHMESILARTDHIDLAKQRLAAILSEPPAVLSRLQAYEFAQSYIADKCPNSANAADRLYYLAMFCRSMMVAAPATLILEVVLLNRRNRQKGIHIRRMRRFLLFSLLAALCMAGFFRMFSGFWQSSIDRTVRAFVLYTSS